MRHLDPRRGVQETIEDIIPDEEEDLDLEEEETIVRTAMKGAIEILNALSDTIKVCHIKFDRLPMLKNALNDFYLIHRRKYGTFQWK